MAISASSVLAAGNIGPGGTAALVVFVLILASVGIFLAFMGSQKRLRENVSKGRFNTSGHGSKNEGAAEQADRPEDALSQDHEDHPGAGA